MRGLSFGQRLRRLREATAVTVADRPYLAGTRWTRNGHLSVNALARLAKLDPSYVQYLEDGRRTRPFPAVVDKLCTALACSDFERAMLLCAAGYWPWPDADDATTELLVALALAVLDGDYRPLEATVREACETGATLVTR